MNEDQLERELTAMSNAIKPTADAPAVLHQAITRRGRRRNAIAATAVAAACATAVVGTIWTTSTSSTPNKAPVAAAPSPSTTLDPVVFGEALERWSTSTANDWVTVADHVVVGTVKVEKETAPTAAEVTRGEGMVGRNVTISVDQTLWSRAGAPATPTQVTLAAPGTLFNGGLNANRRRLAFHDSSRIELGHRYVIAIRYSPATCDSGEVSPARWSGIGSGGVIPYDTKTLGTGEIEGRSNAVASAAELGQSDLRVKLSGKPTTDLTKALGAAKAGTRPSVVASTC
jgi:hypothetical protein